MSGFFSQFATSWVDPVGPMIFLHRMQTARVQFIKNSLGNKKNLMGLDLGAGIGQLSQELAKMGHYVDCVEQESELIMQAKVLHAEHSDRITFFESRAEDFQPLQKYDFIVCMEMLEHVDDPVVLCQQMISWLHPGGSIIMSTINRTTQAYSAAILGAEYILKILPIGTHEFEKFITPHELNHYMEPLICQNIKGLIYNPFEKTFFIGQSLSINYIGEWRSILA